MHACVCTHLNTASSLFPFVTLRCILLVIPKECGFKRELSSSALTTTTEGRGSNSLIEEWQCSNESQKFLTTGSREDIRSHQVEVFILWILLKTNRAHWPVHKPSQKCKPCNFLVILFAADALQCITAIRWAAVLLAQLQCVQ